MKTISCKFIFYILSLLCIACSPTKLLEKSLERENCLNKQTYWNDLNGEFYVTSIDSSENLWWETSLNDSFYRKPSVNQKCILECDSINKELMVHHFIDGKLNDSITLKIKKKNKVFKVRTAFTFRFFLIINATGMVKRNIAITSENDLIIKKDDHAVGYFGPFPGFAASFNNQHTYIRTKT